jgi:hypothetical protein
MGFILKKPPLANEINRNIFGSEYWEIMRDEHTVRVYYIEL